MVKKAFSKEADKATDGSLKIEDVPGPKAFLTTILKKVTPKKMQQAKEAITEKQLTDKEVLALIAENPQMSASTFYNLLKSKGCTIGMPTVANEEEKKEADSSSAFTQMTRAGLDEGGPGSGRKPESGKKTKIPGVDKGASAPPVEMIKNDVFDISLTDEQVAIAKDKFGSLMPKSASDFSYDPKVQAKKADDLEKKMRDKFLKKKKENLGHFNFKSNRFLETIKSQVEGVDGTPQNEVVGFTKFKVVLLQEGMGNFRDAYWYSKEALQSAVPVFEGAKIYADHPSALDEQTRPERTVRDILGNFEDVHLEEGDGGQTMLVGSVNILADDSYRWARSLMEHAVEFSKKYPDKDFIGLSINAAGDANEMKIDDLIEAGVPESALPKLKKAKEEGIDSVRIVSSITNAVSCDLVTEAGAGGKVIQLLENDKTLKENEVKMEMEKKEAMPHSDEQQDIELIKKMIAQHMGDEEVSEEEMGLVKEAYEACKEMGEEEDEAGKKAVAHLKLMKHLAAKKKESAEGEDEKMPMEAEKKEDEAKECEKKESEAKEEEAKKESYIALKAENAQLKESLRKIEIAGHIESLCEKSKLPKHVTKAFREAVGTPKSVEEVNKAWKLFEAGLKKADDELNGFTGLVIAPEKTTKAVGSKSMFDGILKD